MANTQIKGNQIGDGQVTNSDFSSTPSDALAWNKVSKVGATPSEIGAAPSLNPTFSGRVTVPTPIQTSDATTKHYVDTLLQTIDIQFQVQSQTQQTPSPLVVGSNWIVPVSPTYGDWVGHDNEIATYTSGGWSFVVPRASGGVLAWVLDTLFFTVWNGTVWGPYLIDLSGYMPKSGGTFTGAVYMLDAGNGGAYSMGVVGFPVNYAETNFKAGGPATFTSGVPGGYITGLNIYSATGELKHRIDSNVFTIWDAGNDGAASGLDADLLDGNHASAFLTAVAPGTSGNLLTSNGSAWMSVTPVWGASATNATLTRSGSGTSAAPYTLGLNLANPNIWTAAQTFGANTYFPGLGTWTLGGFVGIGTTVPGANLQVAQGTTGSGTVSNLAGGTTVTGVGTQFTNTFKVGDTITIPATTGQTVAISAIASDTSMTTAAITLANSTVAYTLVGGTRFSVLGNGNVGIGTTTPIEALTIQADANSFGLGVISNATSHIGAINFRNVASGTIMNQISAHTATGDLYFNTSASTGAMVLLNNGNVGIGITAPTAQLHLVKADSSALTDFLINPTAKTSGNLIDAQVGGVSKFSVTNAGMVTAQNYAGSLSKTLTGGVETGFVEISVSASGMIGGEIEYTLVANDGTDYQAVAGRARFSAVNKAGTVSGAVSLVGNDTLTSTSGSLSHTVTITPGTGKITLNSNAVSTLTETTLILYYKISSSQTLAHTAL